MKETVRSLELLAPARDREVAIAAIDCGADAVYMGGPDHGARAAAANSVDDIREVCRYAHRYRARVYVTFNTLIYENELAQARETVRALFAAGVDALIVQDMALLRMDIPPIALHASTQCDARTVDKVRFLAALGMSCVVLPREMSVAEIRAVHEAVPDVRLEAFVHGALCVSYSGDCRASLVNGGRSANRGECAQICRLPYDLTDADGNVIMANRHFLSLRDMNRMARLGELADAGVSSFKIEGRLKDKDYVMNTVAAYSAALDALVAVEPERYRRASFGRTAPGFTPDVTRTFNRGYTDYFCSRRPGSVGGKSLHLASMLTPKWVGAEVGTVTRVNGRQVTARLTTQLSNGDGLGFFDKDGRFSGFRVNRVEGNVLHLATPVDLRPGTRLFRNADKAFADTLAAARPRRLICVDITLRAIPGGLALDLRDERGCAVTATTQCEPGIARKPQTAVRAATLSKLGDTIYTAGTITDLPGDGIFVPAGILAALRRDAVALLDHAAAATYAGERRRPEDADAQMWSETLTFHDNVANSQARRLYRDHGAREMAPAMECAMPAADAETHVMTCRYCLRREMGACLRDPQATRRLPATLVLRPRTPGMRPLSLRFDCAACLMTVHALPR